MALTAEETYELRRILAAFKAELPPHELGYWYIETRPEATTVEYEKAPGITRTPRDGRRVQVLGIGECIRCGNHFEIPNLGNFLTYADRIDATIESAKEWVRSIAERNGPCWGDVPNPADDPRRGAAVLDAVAAMREP